MYNVLIIGAGNIGALYDKPNSEFVLTHAHAFNLHEKFRLIGFVDLNKNKAESAAKIWGCQAFESIKQVFINNKIDVISMAVSDDSHYKLLSKIAEFPVKFVIAEKPLAKTWEQASDLIELYKTKNIPMSVNYSRRFVPEFCKIKQDIKNNIYGSYISGTGYYGKGILHNGSHLLDFLRFMLGEINCVDYINHSFDFSDYDPSVSAVLTFDNNQKFIIQHVNCNLYTIFEIDLLFEKKRIRITDSGRVVEIFNITDNPLYQGYKNITKVEEITTSIH